MRAAAADFYHHSIRFVPANVAWGLGLLVVIGLSLLFHPVAGLLLAPLLALPLTGIAALAAQAARGRDVVLSDASSAARRRAPAALAGGALIVLAAAVLGTNVAAGLASGSVVGWSIATLAAWGLVVLAVGCLPFWVLLVDPGHPLRTTREAAQLTGLLLLAHPGRFAGLGLTVAILLAVSTVLFAALLTISVAFALAVAAHTTLPVADRLTARFTTPVPPPADVPVR